MQAVIFDGEKFGQEVRKKISTIVRGMLFSGKISREQLSNLASIETTHIFYQELAALRADESFWRSEVIKNLAHAWPQFELLVYSFGNSERAQALAQRCAQLLRVDMEAGLREVFRDMEEISADSLAAKFMEVRSKHILESNKQAVVYVDTQMREMIPNLLANIDETRVVYESTFDDLRAIVDEVLATTDENKLPSDYGDFICPISMDIIINPVMTPAGHTYEKSAIEEHLSHQQSDPLTRSYLETSWLRPNPDYTRALTEAIISGGVKVELKQIEEILKQKDISPESRNKLEIKLLVEKNEPEARAQLSQEYEAAAQRLEQLNKEAPNLVELKKIIATATQKYLDPKNFQRFDWSLRCFGFHGQTGRVRAQQLSDKVNAASDLGVVAAAIKEVLGSQPRFYNTSQVSTHSLKTILLHELAQGPAEIRDLFGIADISSINTPAQRKAVCRALL